MKRFIVCMLLFLFIHPCLVYALNVRSSTISSGVKTSYEIKIAREKLDDEETNHIISI